MQHNFARIPTELKLLHQWVVWRLELTDNPEKPTKVPYCKTGKASVANPSTWTTFDDACSAPFTCIEAVDPRVSVQDSGYSGIGFMLRIGGGYVIIDLDDTKGDAEALAAQKRIFADFDSYSEISPSGKGIHIVCRGELPGKGRKRQYVEVYDKLRYITFTGNVFGDKPIANCNDKVQTLWREMGGAAESYTSDIVDQPETKSDEQIIHMASNASNGIKFSALWSGDWRAAIDGNDKSQSVADFALIDMLGFYSDNRQQVARLFRQSQLGQRDKAKRNDYVFNMVERSFDRKLPPIDWNNIIRLKPSVSEPGRNNTEGEASDAPLSNAQGQHADNVVAFPGVLAGGPARETATSHATATASSLFPPGLVGDVARFIYGAAPLQVPEVALAGSIALMSGICGRGYNVNGLGLSQYIMLLGRTGIGKEAAKDGIAAILNEVAKTVPAAVNFRGPSYIASAQGMIRALEKQPCILSIIGEIGGKLRELASDKANANTQNIKSILLELYSASSRHGLLGSSSYSDISKNTNVIQAPSFTLLGETVPEEFYETMTPELVSGGLLPRFLTFETLAPRQHLNENRLTTPDVNMVTAIADISSRSLNLIQYNPIDVQFAPDAAAKFREYARWITDEINRDLTNRTAVELWNRAHIKAMKLAAICAVGINPFTPVITMDETMWATNIVAQQTRHLIGKFERGETGEQDGDDAQVKETVRLINRYMREDWSASKTYGGTEQMRKQHVMPWVQLQRRLVSTAIFRKDRRGATNAIKAAVQILIDNNQLREVSKIEMEQRFNQPIRAFVINNEDYFNEQYMAR